MRKNRGKIESHYGFGVHIPKVDFMKTFHILTYKRSPGEVWRDFILMSACALSNPLDKTNFDKREKMYLDCIKKYDRKEQVLFPKLFSELVMALEENTEQDFLGSVFMDMDLGNERNGQYFTPYSVCQMMAAITVDKAMANIASHGYVTIHDPCCGSGATMIAGVHEIKKQLEKEKLNFQNYVLAIGQDIDYTAALMCYIQLSLLGIAGYIKVGNTLTEPMVKNDVLDDYWFTPMYFSQVWKYRRLFKGGIL